MQLLKETKYINIPKIIIRKIMQYSRTGMYSERKIIQRHHLKKEENKIDWINVLLFIALIIIVLMFLIWK